MLFGECYTLLSFSYRSFLRPPNATPFVFFPYNLLSSQPIFLPRNDTRISNYNTNCLKLIPSSESGTLSEFHGHRKFHNSPPLATVLRQTNPFHSFDLCIFKIHINVIRSTQVSPTLSFPHRNPLTIFLVRPACHISRPSQSPCFVIVTIFGKSRNYEEFEF